MQMLFMFIGLSVVNVILQTCCHIATVKCGKLVAAFANAIAYGVYTYVIIFTAIDGIAMWQKALIVATANFIGVYIVKTLEHRLEKEKMWKIEMAIPLKRNTMNTERCLINEGIPCNFRPCGEWMIYDCYCMTKEHTKFIMRFTKEHEGKCSAFETKLAIN